MLHVDKRNVDENADENIALMDEFSWLGWIINTMAEQLSQRGLEWLKLTKQQKEQIQKNSIELQPNIIDVVPRYGHFKK